MTTVEEVNCEEHKHINSLIVYFVISLRKYNSEKFSTWIYLVFFGFAGLISVFLLGKFVKHFYDIFSFTEQHITKKQSMLVIWIILLTFILLSPHADRTVGIQ